MPREANDSSDWLAPASHLLEDASFSWAVPVCPPDGRDLPDADLDALAEAMLAGLRRNLGETEVGEQITP